MLRLQPAVVGVPVYSTDSGFVPRHAPDSLRTPALNREQRELFHSMTCTRVGCTRCTDC
jgi:hypothetical protein